MNINEKTQSVWQRVQAHTPDYTKLPGLIAEEKTDSVLYLHLSHQIGGKDGALLRRMFEEERVHISCLKGIYRMCTGERCSTPATAAPQEPITATLRRCYGREMRCLAAYEALAADPEYGAVFAKLAAQEREHCHNILTIIGKIDL